MRPFRALRALRLVEALKALGLRALDKTT